MCPSLNNGLKFNSCDAAMKHIKCNGFLTNHPESSDIQTWEKFIISKKNSTLIKTTLYHCNYTLKKIDPFDVNEKKTMLLEKKLRNTEALASNRNMWSWQWPLWQSRDHNLMRGVGLPGSLFCLQLPVGEFGYLLRGWRFLRRSRGYLRFRGIPSGASHCPCLLWDRRLWCVVHGVWTVSQ